MLTQQLEEKWRARSVLYPEYESKDLVTVTYHTE